MSRESRRRRRASSPARTIVAGFGVVIAIGTVLLSLPISHEPGVRVGILDAFFTSTSAVCVTGLIVVDTGGAFSRFGETVIMLLIKTGGLGILSLGVLLALATRRRLGFRERQGLQAQAGGPGPGGVAGFTRTLLVFTTTVELAGAAVLYLRFRGTEGVWEGAYYALFHSISAFNNAGFALYVDSLSRYVADPIVSLSVPILFILGGLGMPVFFDLADRLSGGPRRVMLLNTKAAVAVTALLLAAGTVAIAIMEWQNPATLGELGFFGKLQAAFFQGATPRTAGFNSVDFGAMHSGTLVLVMVLMFIGGNPGSTAGGIKTTTFLVLISSAWAYARGRAAVYMFGRRIEPELTIRAGVVATLGALLSAGGLIALTFTERTQPFLSIFFEAVSALGTVGLSLGATPELSAPGKLIIIGLMFTGRIGLLTFALALAEERQVRRLRYPREDVIIG